MKLIIFIALSLFSLQSFAVPESDFDQVYALLQNQDQKFFAQKTFVAEDHARIAYTQFGFHQGQKGTLVIAPGRTESSMKYIEVAYDMIDQGFSPVFVIDHRGQGFSPRSLADSHKGHITDFKTYVSDFVLFTALITSHSLTHPKNLYLLSHSMGGAIITEYLSLHPSPYKKVAMISPMHKIKNEKSENEILQETALACAVGRCDDYIPGGGPFKWSERVFENNDVTHSRVRFDFRDHLWRTWPELQLGSPTVRWVREAVQSNIRGRSYESLRNVRPEILILQAQKDSVVDNPAQHDICKNLYPKCKLGVVKGARHEILMEKDRLRSAALREIQKFFN